MRIVVLNGPSGSGKTTLARTFKARNDPAKTSTRLSAIMDTAKVAALAGFGLSPEMVDTYEREGLKDTSLDALEGRSPRQVYTEYAEQKRKDYGQRYFADMWLKAEAANLATSADDYLVVHDVRFECEIEAANTLVGWHRVLLVKTYRKGASWANDVGSYCTEHFGRVVSLRNDGYNIARTADTLMAAINRWQAS